MKKAVAYMRYSSDNQRETSIEYQRDAIRSYCQKNNTQLVHEYIDMAISGKYDRRPNFRALMQDAKAKPVWDTVLVFDYSRFCRNYRDAANYTDLLNRNNISLVSVTEDYGSGEDSFMMVGMAHLRNEDQSRRNGIHTFAGMKYKARHGGHCGGIPPLGYDLKDGSLVINPEEAETVLKIFNMYEMGYSYSKMAAILNSEGRTTKTGAPFTKYSFHELLRQEKYIGTYTWNKSTKKNSEGARNSHAYKPIDQQIRIPDRCPQIITPERFQAAQEKLAARAKGKAGSKSRNHYVLSGIKILKCAVCGSYLIGTSRSSHGKPYTTYSCPNHKGNNCPTKEIRTENLDRMVIGLLVKDLHQRDDLSRISKLLSHNDDYNRLLAKKRGNEKAIANVTRAIKASYSEHLISELEKLEREQASLARAIAASTTKKFEITSENIKSVCKQFGRYLLSSDDPDTKAYLSSVVQEILVSNEEVSITLKIA